MGKGADSLSPEELLAFARRVNAHKGCGEVSFAPAWDSPAALAKNLAQARAQGQSPDKEDTESEAEPEKAAA